MVLLDVLRLLEARGGSGTCAALGAVSVASLLRLELDTHGAVSDVTALEGAPLEWTYLGWQVPEQKGAIVVCRGRPIRLERLRPEPRLAQARDAAPPHQSSRRASHTHNVPGSSRPQPSRRHPHLN
eukprot:4012153-Prymnesium_polylepis.2